MFRLRDREITEKIVKKIRDMDVKITAMHVCGGHQDTLVRYGLDPLLREVGVDVRQGPGCPVCVTTPKEIEEVMLLGKSGRTIMAFGDMMRVPGADRKTMFDLRCEGADVRMVYSIDDAVSYAKKFPDKDVIFLAIGFETTAPTTAAVLLSKPPENFSVLCTHRYVPPALKGILDLGEVKLHGLVEPGHVSTIIGTKPYEFITRDYRVPQVVAGFEPVDLMMSFFMLAKQIHEGRCELEIEYSRVVHPEGNLKALKAMDEAFEPVDWAWRGFGVIPGSGMGLRKEFQAHDARLLFEDTFKELDGKDFSEPPGCKCGDVLRGIIFPKDCPLFGKGCTPQNPIGPCMVTAEGSCNIDHKYGTHQ